MPEDRRLTISSSSQLAPDEVARHSFATVRRGYDHDEVRAYLESLAQALRAQAEHDQDLRRELEEAERRAANPVLDEDTLAAALGNETTRVLRSAHEAASEMVAKATAESEELLETSRAEIAATEERVSAQLAERVAAAEAEAAELRRAAEEDAAAAGEEARTRAEELLDRTRDDCREMVDEAQALRARVLADLSKRRRVLHAQIEQLRAGREHLADTVREVRTTIDTIADDLFKAEDEARLAAEAAGREAVARSDDLPPEELAALLQAEAGSAPETAAGPPVAEAGAAVAVTEVVGVVESVDEGGEVTRVVSASAITEVIEVEVEPIGVEEADPGPAGEDALADRPSVDDLFARLKASRAEETEPDTASDEVEEAAPAAGTGAVETEAEQAGAAGEGAADEGAPGGPDQVRAPIEDAGAEGEQAGADEGEEAEDEAEADEDGPPADAHPQQRRRDELTAPIVTALARRLKRTLQDDQNDLLDRLRSGRSSWSPGVLPAEPEHHDAYATAALPFLEEAGQAGASFAGSEGKAVSTDELLAVAAELADTVVGPLRRRLADDGGLAGGGEAEAAEHVGSAFREWKGERVERLAGDFVSAAFSAGSIAGARRRGGVTVEWVAVAGDGGEPCPDCEDNALNGPQAPGEEFPTGHVRPPAHPGCRCLLATAAT